MANQDNNNNNKRKRSDDDENVNHPPIKRRKTFSTHQIKKAFDNLLLVKASGLNGIYLQLLQNVNNQKRYRELENLYKNEEMEIINLLLQNSYKIDSLNDKKYSLNHTFQNLPLDKVKGTFQNEEDVEEIDEEILETDEDSDLEEEEYDSEEEEDSDFNPLEEAKRMVEEVFGIVTEEKEKSKCDYLIENSNLSQEEKDRLMKEFQKIEEIRKNQVPDKLKILGLDIPIDVKVEILEKMELIDKSPQEDVKTREWLKQVMKIPFNKYSANPIKDVSNTEDVKTFITDFHNTLDKAIYGQNKVKETLIEIITKWATSGSQKGNCIAISGPPGVGKTSIVREGLAKALNRPFCSFSLAGISDENYLTGFPFTYEGATCGRFAKMVMDTGCMNPIIFMDELDKVDIKKSMSVYNKLIEITDFSQNHEIEDHYFGSNIKLDMSKCIFVFSLNDINLVDPILRDRLEVIEVEGFGKKDKIKIAQDFLIPSVLKEYKEKYNFTEDIIKHILMRVQEEQGVRNLNRAIDQIVRKLNVLQYYNNKKLSYKLKKFNKKSFKITTKLVDILLKDNKKVDSIILKMYN